MDAIVPDEQSLSTTPAIVGAEYVEQFQKNNPKSGLGSLKNDKEKRLAIVKPWGDTSIALTIPQEKSAAITFLKELSNVFFPERLSAIFHKDKNDLEVIWTAFKVSSRLDEVKDRSFSISYAGVDYNCNFALASERAKLIAKNFVEVGPTESAYRNLTSFRGYMIELERNKGSIKVESNFDVPRSFWIRNIALEEDDLISFLETLNFYISYYDDLSPMVLIHAPQTSVGSIVNHNRYRIGKFPEKINTKPLDLQLLQFWKACQQPDSSRRFLYSYRIIEHAAFYFVESAPKLAIKKVLLTPHALDDINQITNDVIIAMKKSRIDDYAKMENVIKTSVDPELLWAEIASNIDAFNSKTDFEGDFSIDALVTSDKSHADFINSGIPNFCSTIRKIRNALSHGKEERTAGVILPTKHNYDKLLPWASLISIAAGEVILYDSSF
ncbi:hypothetical protein [Phyllobacterium sp. K27]